MRLSNKALQYIRDQAPPFKASLDSPTTFSAGYTSYVESEGRVHIFSRTDSKHIFGDSLLHYRAWHDMLHYDNKIDFGDMNEMILADLMFDLFQDAGLPFIDCALVQADLKSHIYHYLKYKKHPINQPKLIKHCLFHGYENIPQS